MKANKVVDDIECMLAMKFEIGRGTMDVELGRRTMDDTEIPKDNV
jgi:hypothetical protein